MRFFAVKSAADLWRKYAIIFLSFSWVFGLASGLLYSFCLYPRYDPLVMSALFADVTIVDIMLISVIPIVLSVLCVHCSFPVLLIPLAFFKAFSFSISSFRLLWAFGNAGWLLRFLLMFSDCALVVVLLWLWIRHINGSKLHLVKDAVTCTQVMFVVGVIDCLFIVPVLQTVFH